MTARDEQTGKQEGEYKTNTIDHAYILSLQHSPVILAHYLIYNLFRILRPLRRKYRLTINELVVLNGIYLYNQNVSSNFTKGSIRLYNGYFNNNKSDYYIKSLCEKGCISLVDKGRSFEYYKITVKGIEIVNDFGECYKVALEKFCKDNNIPLG